MKPKSRKEILDVCQSNFWNYSTLTKVMIVISVLLSAGSIALYLCGYILPAIQGVVYGEIVGWGIVWEVCLAFVLYYILQFANLIFVSIGGSAMCREEEWDTLDFAKAWVDFYEYEKYIDTEDLEDLEDLNDENSDK
jgi:hypothetical protein